MTKKHSRQAIGIFGGTFDPIHKGHLLIAMILLKQLPLEQIRFIPCKTPLLKNAATASPQQRLAMLHLALDPFPKLHIDDLELRREGPSYTVTTLQHLTKRYPEVPLCLILGADVFNELTQWYHWREILTLSHVIIVNRNTKVTTTSKALQQLLQQAITDVKQLQQQKAGLIYLQHIPPLEIASAAIRQSIKHGENINYLLPRSVPAYIQQQNLYQ